MDLAALSAALVALADGLATTAASSEQRVLLVPEGRTLCLRLGVRDGEVVLDVCIAASPSDVGTCRTLLRTSVLDAQRELRAADLAGRVSELGYELMRAAAWTDQMLLPRHHAPPSLPTEAAFEARRREIRDALTAPVELPAPWTAAVSVPLPAAWPFVPGTPLVSYVAATRVGSPTVFEHSDLLARVHYDALAVDAPRWERLCPTVAGAGHAAVVPLAASELESVRALPPLDRTLAMIALGMPDPQVTTTLRAHYRFARRRSAWLCELTRSSHAALWRFIDEG